MTEENSVNYKDGDIVWVKLGPTWWPGEVKDINNLPSEFQEFKKPPLVIVKFFDEESYEYVKAWNNIFPYNCERKNEFIKKGMNSFRAKASHMQKFPKDVSAAEVKIGGNANILSDPMFLPEKKLNISEIFGTPSPKRSIKDVDHKKKGQFSSTKKEHTYITHRRFLGYDDYEALVFLQYPGKDFTGDVKEKEEMLKLYEDPAENFTCEKCTFVTKRLEVMILHSKSHLQGVYNSGHTTKKAKKTNATRKPRKNKPSKDIFDSSLDSDSSLDESLKGKKIQGSKNISKKGKKRLSEDSISSLDENNPKKIKSKVLPPKTAEEVKTDIQNDLLAEWDDSDDEEIEKIISASDTLNKEVEDIICGKSIENNIEEENETSNKKTDDEDNTLSRIENITINENSTDRVEKKTETVVNSDIKNDIKSCFDFDEEEEEDSPIVETAVGRKIPRVIPPSERRISTDNFDASLPTEEDDVNRMEILKESESFNEPLLQNDDDSKNIELENTFKDLMETATVPVLPVVENTLKCEQNFHDSKTIKFPDKTEPTESSSCTVKQVDSKVDKIVKEPSEIATKLTNPKKRFVKSFEDFEQFQIEQKRIAEEEGKKEKADLKTKVKSDETANLSPSEITDEVLSKLKSQIMSKIVEEIKETEEQKCLKESSKKKSNSSYQSPRSKILESYKNDTDKHNTETEQELQKGESENVHTINIEKELKTDTLKENEEENVQYLNKKNQTKNVEEETTTQNVEVETTVQNVELLNKKNETDTKKVEIETIQNVELINEKDITENVEIETTMQNIENENESKNVEIEKTKQNMKLLGKDNENETTNMEVEIIKNAELLNKEDDNKYIDVETSIQNVEQLNKQDEIENIDIEYLNKKNEDEIKNVELRESIQEEASSSCHSDIILPKKKNWSRRRSSAKRESFSHINEEKNIDVCIANTFEKSDFPDETKSLTEQFPVEAELKTDSQEELSHKINQGMMELDKFTEKDLTEVENLEIDKSNNFLTKTLSCTENSNLTDTTKVALGNDKTDLNFTKDDNEDAKLQPLEKEDTLFSNKFEKEIIASIDDPMSIPSEDNLLEEHELISPNKDIFPTKKLDVFSVMETSSVLPDDAICSPIKKRSFYTRETACPNIDEYSESLAITARAKLELSNKKEEKDIYDFTDSLHEEKQTTETEILTQTTEQENLPKENKSTEYGKTIEERNIVETLLHTTVDDSEKTSEEKTNFANENNAISIKSDLELGNEASPSKSEASEITPTVSEELKETDLVRLDSDIDYELSVKSKLSKVEEMSALTLASLSEAKTDSSTLNTEEKIDIKFPQHDFEEVPIEGNLTVMSEKDLADGQVEIPADSLPISKKPITLMNFSLDFAEPDNNTTSEIKKIIENDYPKNDNTTTVPLKEINKYERYELLDILEGKSAVSSEVKKPVCPVEDMLDFEEHIPSQIVRTKSSLQDGLSSNFIKETKKVSKEKDCSKLLERLTKSKDEKNSDTKKSEVGPHSSKLNVKDVESPVKTESFNKGLLTSSQKSSKTKLLIKSSTPNKSSSGKPIILSEKIIKAADNISVTKKPVQENDSNKKTPLSKSGKAKIIQQTIITPEGQIIQPKIGQVQTDENIFDINSMPIVLSEDILTPEGIDTMPIVLGDTSKASTSKPTEKILITSSGKKILAQPTRILGKPLPSNTLTPVIKPQTKLIKQPRILQTSTKLIKHPTLLPSSEKTNKYIIMPQSATIPSQKNKKATLIKRTVNSPSTSKVQNIAPEPSGNKIMIVTNQQGEQQRVLLTPAQQKMIGYQTPNAKISKTVMKGNVIQKTITNQKGSVLEAGPSGVSKNIRTLQTITTKVPVGLSSKQTLLSSGSSPLTNIQSKNLKGGKMLIQGQKAYPNIQKPQRTILIKNQHGHTVKRIQGTDDALLDKQVAEQIEAIKASSALKLQSQKQDIVNYKSLPKTQIKKYSKKVSTVQETMPISPLPSTSLVSTTSHKNSSAIPPLSPISNKKVEVQQTVTEAKARESTKGSETSTERKVHQLVIQDALGNQTTITEGQILALPSETVDGQPQSYMLVTLDESGSLTPLNNEALMSLDPNLLGGGDLGNIMLQIDQPPAVASTSSNENLLVQEAVVTTNSIIDENKTISATTTVQPEISIPEVSNTTEINTKDSVVSDPSIEPATSDTGQQLIVTGDPIATQKFLESLTEGTTDLANILANAEGSSIVIQADGQQIIINTNAENQMMLSVNNDNLNSVDNSESGGNPMFATQPSKNQDILAAALADTDVFQQDTSSSQNKLHSQLSPGSTLYPMNVGNVLETSLTLSSPIMTPLEVPSTNSKKIPDEEADILTQVPKNVDLPITITDPNISQTVAQQQVASLMTTELQTNLELSLPISEATISASSSEMNSPSFVYSLPSLDEINQKPFNSSMPLLTEDAEEISSISTNNVEIETTTEEIQAETSKSIETDINGTLLTKHLENIGSSSKETNQKSNLTSVDSFMEEEEGLCTLGGEMCSSLSEPPPDMFDVQERAYTPPAIKTVVSEIVAEDSTTQNSPVTNSPVTNSPSTITSEDSCEIPIQPEIVTTEISMESPDFNSVNLKRNCEDDDNDHHKKKCKFD